MKKYKEEVIEYIKYAINHGTTPAVMACNLSEIFARQFNESVAPANSKKARNWKKEFLKLHYEPEHEAGQVCWCKPKTIVRNKVAYIEHNEQRVLLVEFINKLI